MRIPPLLCSAVLIAAVLIPRPGEAHKKRTPRGVRANASRNSHMTFRPEMERRDRRALRLTSAKRLMDGRSSGIGKRVQSAHWTGSQLRVRYQDAGAQDEVFKAATYLAESHIFGTLITVPTRDGDRTLHFTAKPGSLNLDEVPDRAQNRARANAKRLRLLISDDLNHSGLLDTNGVANASQLRFNREGDVVQVLVPIRLDRP